MAKSYKREVAGACLLFVGASYAYTFMGVDDPKRIAELVPLINGIGTAVVWAGLAVFGLHHVVPAKKDGGS